MRKLIVLALTGALALPGGAALARGARTPTDLTAKLSTPSSGDVFSGSVNSGDPTCEAARKVALIWRRSGSTQTIGSATSSSRGKWRVAFSGAVPAGEYFAKTRSTKTCAAATSRIVTRSS